jgi:hypothetical protein
MAANMAISGAGVAGDGQVDVLALLETREGLIDLSKAVVFPRQRVVQHDQDRSRPFLPLSRT